MRGVIEVIFAIVFIMVTGATVLSFSNQALKKEALKKVEKGLSSMEGFTQELTGRK